MIYYVMGGLILAVLKILYSSIIIVVIAMVALFSITNKQDNEINEFPDMGEKQACEERVIFFKIIEDTYAKHGVKDDKGNIIVDLKYSMLSDYKYGYSIFENRDNDFKNIGNDTVGIIDKEGKEILCKSRNDIFCIHSISEDGILSIEKLNGNRGYMNLDGELLFEGKYSCVAEFYKEYGMGVKENEIFRISKSGEELKITEGKDIFYIKNGVYLIKKNGEHIWDEYSVCSSVYSIVDYKGNIIRENIGGIKFKFTNNGKLIVSSDDVIRIEVGKLDKSIGKEKWINIKLDGTEQAE